MLSGQREKFFIGLWLSHYTEANLSPSAHKNLGIATACIHLYILFVIFRNHIKVFFDVLKLHNN